MKILSGRKKGSTEFQRLDDGPAKVDKFESSCAIDETLKSKRGEALPNSSSRQNKKMQDKSKQGGKLSKMSLVASPRVVKKLSRYNSLRGNYSGWEEDPTEGMKDGYDCRDDATDTGANESIRQTATAIVVSDKFRFQGTSRDQLNAKKTKVGARQIINRPATPETEASSSYDASVSTAGGDQHKEGKVASHVSFFEERNATVKVQKEIDGKLDNKRLDSLDSVLSRLEGDLRAARTDNILSEEKSNRVSNALDLIRQEIDEARARADAFENVGDLFASNDAFADFEALNDFDAFDAFNLKTSQ